MLMIIPKFCVLPSWYPLFFFFFGILYKLQFFNNVFNNVLYSKIIKMFYAVNKIKHLEQ